MSLLEDAEGVAEKESNAIKKMAQMAQPQNQGSDYSQILFALASIIVSSIIAFLLDNLRDRRQNRNELRKNHLSDIKSDVLQPLLEKLVQIETMIHENMYSRLNEPKDFSELSPPVKSGLYEALGAHFPETVSAWNEYHSDLVNWARKCQKLYNSLKSSVETEAKVKLPCECGLAWHDFLDPLVQVAYFDLFA
jgi:hypothetical protein